MLNLLLIIVSFSSGYLVQLAGLTTKNAHRGINVWVLNIALPAIFLRNIPDIKFGTELILPMLAPVLVWLGGYIIFTVLGKIWHLPPSTEAALKLTAGLSNTSFLGFVAVYYGEKNIGIAVVYDQITFILLSTVALITALLSSGSSSVTTGFVLYKLIKFPPFVACVIALTLPCFVNFSALNSMLDKIGSTIGPLALFSIGMQLKLSSWKKHFKFLSAGLCYKHLIAPAIILALAVLFGQRGLATKITVFQAAMPTLATASVLAEDTNLDAELSNLMVGFGVIFSFISTAFCWYVLQNLF